MSIEYQAEVKLDNDNCWYHENQNPPKHVCHSFLALLLILIVHLLKVFITHAFAYPLSKDFYILIFAQHACQK